MSPMVGTACRVLARVAVFEINNNNERKQRRRCIGCALAFFLVLTAFYLLARPPEEVGLGQPPDSQQERLPVAAIRGSRGRV